MAGTFAVLGGAASASNLGFGIAPRPSSSVYGWQPYRTLPSTRGAGHRPVGALPVTAPADGRCPRLGVRLFELEVVAAAVNEKACRPCADSPHRNFLLNRGAGGLPAGALPHLARQLSTGHRSSRSKKGSMHASADRRRWARTTARRRAHCGHDPGALGSPRTCAPSAHADARPAGCARPGVQRFAPDPAGYHRRFVRVAWADDRSGHHRSRIATRRPRGRGRSVTTVTVALPSLCRLPAIPDLTSVLARVENRSDRGERRLAKGRIRGAMTMREGG